MSSILKSTWYVWLLNEDSDKVQDTVKAFSKNWIFRPDCLFFLIVYKTYSNHYNYNDIKQYLSFNFGNGAKELIQLCKNVHNYSDDEMQYVTSFNMDQSPDLVLINIFCLQDPLINRVLITDNFKIINFEKNCIGHCSDMGFTSNMRVTSYIIDALNLTL